MSIEDYDPEVGAIEPIEVAVARVAAAAAAAKRSGMVLTARAENHLYGVGDLEDTIARLVAYRDAGAEFTALDLTPIERAAIVDVYAAAHEEGGGSYHV